MKTLLKTSLILLSAALLGGCLKEDDKSYGQLYNNPENAVQEGLPKYRVECWMNELSEPSHVFEVEDTYSTNSGAYVLDGSSLVPTSRCIIHRL